MSGTLNSPRTDSGPIGFVNGIFGSRDAMSPRSGIIAMERRPLRLHVPPSRRTRRLRSDGDALASFPADSRSELTDEEPDLGFVRCPETREPVTLRGDAGIPP